jgi:hypothetical protein
MQYVLTIYEDEAGYAGMTPDQESALMAAYEAFGREAAEAGVMRAGEALQPVATATTVRVRDGERLLTDGPFAETREQLGGFYVVDVPDLDSAIAWAAKIPGASTGCVEVRPLMVFEDGGAEPQGSDAAASA